MATEAEVDRLVDEARAMQDDERYGLFTNAVMLGLLLAAEMLDAIDR